ncbi:choice-of-anchor A family protein [bacterium]|nr:choice-of-anchor A family protein [bacterium]
MVVFKWIRNAAFLAISISLPLSAQAYNPLSSISDYNALIFGNAQAAGGGTEGRMAVGGDLLAKWYGVGTSLTPDASSYSLIVGEDLNAEGAWQVYNGNTAYGGELISSPSTSSSYTISNNSDVLDFESLLTGMQSTSDNLTSLTSSGTFVYDGYSTVTLTGTSDTLNVFNLTDEQATVWSNVSSHVISAPAGSTVIVNVGGETCTLSYGMTLNGIDCTHVLFNYYDASSLTINSMSLQGSLLAPDAALTLNYGGINGITVAGSSTQNSSSFRSYAFDGDVPMVPEPSTLAVCLTGLGLAIPLIRRRLC